MTLQEAWKKRLDLCAEASAFAKRAGDIKKDRFNAAAHSRMTIWYAAVATYYEGEKEQAAANALLFEADTIWFNAVHETLGNVRASWTYVEGKGYRCELENGATFEP